VRDFRADLGILSIGGIEPHAGQRLAIERIDATAEQTIAKAQRIAVDLDQHDIRQQRCDRRRVEMLAARQPVRRVNALPVG